MTPITPDLPGYQDALLRKRDALGSTVNFHFPSTPVWPTGTQLDPLTGRPFDPLIESESESGPDAIELKLSVAFRPSFQEDTKEASVGNVKTNLALVWVTMEEWAEVEEATSFDYQEDNYLIRKTTEEAIGGESWRVLIWGERQTEGGNV